MRALSDILSTNSVFLSTLHIASAIAPAMANDEHVALLKQGVNDWNAWRQENESIEIDLRGADLRRAHFVEAHLDGADLRKANLVGTKLILAYFTEADLSAANLSAADLMGTDLSAANLSAADLTGATLREATLSGATLAGVNFTGAQLIETNLANANLTGCQIYGVSAWNINLEGAQQKDLILTREDEPVITVDNLEVAQFIYLLLHNEKIRDVINTIGKKGVLILGRFTERKDILENLRDALRQRDYLPIVFDFERPTDRDFTETVMTLAGMCLFIIADITHPKSIPLELQATIPN
jgi:uncharacterized protein YjbI with pentapeptide repeats